MMANIQLHPIVQGIEKSIGTLNFYRVNGKTHVRRKVAAGNPRTAAQQKNRTAFHRAVRAWQELTTDEKDLWNTRAQVQHRRGYHLYISEYMRSRLV